MLSIDLFCSEGRVFCFAVAGFKFPNHLTRQNFLEQAMLPQLIKIWTTKEERVILAGNKLGIRL